jgi:small subunit ribosomal protein S6
MEYELLFFTSLANEERVGEIKGEIEEAIVARGGKISAEFSDIGKRKLAYPIKKQTHAFFSFCHFTMDEKDNLPELNRRLNLNEKIMRHLIVRADEIGKPISAQSLQTQRQETKTETPTAPAAAKTEQKSEEKKPAEPEGKIGITELDEKLDEILEETPE